MSQLLGLCPEVLNAIFLEVNPEDLASLSKTCRLFYLFIKNDRLLWRELYLREYVSGIKEISSIRSPTNASMSRITFWSSRAKQSHPGKQSSRSLLSCGNYFNLATPTSRYGSLTQCREYKYLLTSHLEDPSLRDSQHRRRPPSHRIDDVHTFT